jgi:hypothetical protein
MRLRQAVLNDIERVVAEAVKQALAESSKDTSGPDKGPKMV